MAAEAAAASSLQPQERRSSHAQGAAEPTPGQASGGVLQERPRSALQPPKSPPQQPHAANHLVHAEKGGASQELAIRPRVRKSLFHGSDVHAEQEQPQQTDVPQGGSVKAVHQQPAAKGGETEALCTGQEGNQQAGAAPRSAPADGMSGYDAQSVFSFL
jgi:hypothetical protein